MSAAPAASDLEVTEACQRTLFEQVPNSFAAAGVVTLYMVATALPYSNRRTVLGWLLLQLTTQVARFALLRAYGRLPAPARGAALRRAVAGNTAYMLCAGLVWGATAFLFIHLAAPLSLALTMCGLYGIAGGSVPGNAYHPAGLYCFVGAIFTLVLARLLLLGGGELAVLGAASAGYAGILFLFCRVQHRALRQGFAIRFENMRLLTELAAEKAEAEAARARAEQANLAKSQLLAAASHDLRQPLHALGLFAGSLQGMALDPRARDVAVRIDASVAAMEGLFTGLLDISRLEAGAIRAAPEPMCLAALFARLAGYFDPVAEEAGLDLMLRDGRLWVRADPALTERICANLIGNALRYTPRGGVLVAARRRAGAVSIEVVDTGIGIAPADQTRVFEDFVQLHNPERDRARGMGLGLAIAQRLAVLQGSRITLRSFPGKGARFAFSLPEAAPPVGEPAAAACSGIATAPADAVAGLHLLLIDDDAAVRDGTALLLDGWGVRLTACATPEEALAELRAGLLPNLCLSDFRLPGRLDGIAALAAVRALAGPRTWLCLLTGDMSAELLARAGEAGLPVLHKPLQPARLRALLTQAGARPMGAAVPVAS